MPNFITPTQVEIDTEISIIGACLFDAQNGYQRIHELITPEMFGVRQHQTIFEAIAKTAAPHDMIGVITTLSKSGKLQDAGGQAAITRMMEICVHAHDLERDAGLLTEAHQKREALRISHEIQAAIEAGDVSRAAALGESLSDVGCEGIAPGGDLVGEVDRLIDRGLAGASMKAAIGALAGRYRQSARDIEAIVNERLVENTRADDRADTQAEILRLQAARQSSLDLLQILPTPIANAINHLADTLNLRPECYAMTLLATASTLHKNGSEVRLLDSSNYTVTPGLYAGIVAPPSQRKTPIVKAMATSPLRRLHATAKNCHEVQLEDWQERCKSAKQNGEEPPAQPAQRLYHFTSTTGEAIMRQASRQPENGMLYLCDELKSLFGSANAYRGGKGSDMEDLLRYYDGDGGKVLRTEGLRDDIDVFNFGIVGAIQPEVLRKLLGDGSDANGQWARFVFVEQPVVPNIITSDSGSVDVTGLLEAAYRRIDGLPEMEYHLAPDAKQRWMDKRNEYEIQRCQELRPAMSAYLGKSDGRIGKFAMNLHVLNWAVTAPPNTVPTEEIPLAIVEAAIALTDFSIAQIESIYAELSNEASVAPHLAKILHHLNLKGELKPKDVYSGIHRRLLASERNKSQKVLDWFTELELMGLAEVVKVGRSVKLIRKGDRSGDRGDQKVIGVITSENLAQTGLEPKGDQGDRFTPDTPNSLPDEKNPDTGKPITLITFSPNPAADKDSTGDHPDHFCDHLNENDHLSVSQSDHLRE